MRGPTLTTTVLGLLVCCLTVNSNPAPAVFTKIDGPQFASLSTAIINSLESRITEGLKAVNETIQKLKPQVSTCITDIEEEQKSCTEFINSTCQKRVDTLQCTNVQTSPSGSPSCAPKALCDMQNLVNKAEAGIVVIGKNIENLAKKAISALKKVSEEVVNTIGDGFKTAGNAIKNVAEEAAAGVKNTAKKVVSGVENVAKEVGETIVNGLEDAGKAIANVVEDGVNGIKDGANEVKNFFENLGRKRRQTVSEPVCDDFAKNETACLFYRDQSPSCVALGTSETEPAVEDLILVVCGQSQLKNYVDLDSAIASIDQITELAKIFTLYEVKANLLVFKGTGFDVEFTYGMSSRNETRLSSTPTNPYVPAVAGPLIAGDIFKLELPTAA